MSSKDKTAKEGSSWLNSIYEAFKAVPINFTLFVVSAFIFYKIINFTGRRGEPGGQQDQVVERSGTLPPLVRDFTVAEMMPYNWSQEDGRILIAINFNIYDVSSAQHIYGSTGTLRNYGGRDISRNLINFTIERNEREEYDDLSDLSSDQLSTLREWEKQYKQQYPFVGKLLPDNEPRTTSN